MKGSKGKKSGLLVTTSQLQYVNGKWEAVSSDLASFIDDSPDPGILEAIEAFHSRYYPDEASNDERYPWNIHRSPQGADRLKELLKRHELTWHWRMLLPALRGFKEHQKHGNAVVLCVSQIRQWQLMSCFTMQWPDDAAPQALAPAVRTARKALLRPPVFGKSHRITRHEVYASFYELGTRAAINKALTAAAKDGFRRAHILGRYDTYLRVLDADIEASPIPTYKVTLQHIIDLEPEQAPLELEGETTDDVCRPYSLVHVPRFVRDADAAPRELLFSSDNYCRAFEQISDVLNDPSARSVLVIAPPGSGKEDLSAVLHYCRGGKPTSPNERASGAVRREGNVITISAAGDDLPGVARQLFSLAAHPPIDTRFKWVDGDWVPHENFTATIEDGAVFRALRGTLVIDELDKASDSIRAMLLRYLENDAVAVPQTSVVVTIPKELRPLNVFVGSKPRKDFLQLRPVDFWSRMTHIIEMQHPLAISEPMERYRVAEDYLRHFWLISVQAFFGSEQLLKQREALYEPVRDIFTEWWRFFCCRHVGESVCREIATVLCGEGQPLPSIRTLRGTVARCLNSLYHALLFNKHGESPLERWRRQSQNPARDLRQLFEQHSKREDLTGPAIAAIDHIREIVRASATIQV